MIDYKHILAQTWFSRLLCLGCGLALLGQWGLAARDWFAVSRIVQSIGSPALKESSKRHTRNDNTVFKTPLFGEYVPKSLTESDIKQSMLDLTLVGILFAPDERDSHVLIRTSKGRELSFRVGDAVPGGAIVKRITRDGVLFERLGALERLSLPKDEPN